MKADFETGFSHTYRFKGWNQALSSSGFETAFNLHSACIQLVQPHRGVALQVEFERQILKLVFHLMGFRLWV
jgi:hypothetical protein